jgi:hypothetical protein
VRVLAAVLGVAAVASAAVLGATATATTQHAAKQTQAIHFAHNSKPTTCGLRHGVKHVVYLIFDNVHFLRDNPNVPSDLEQMPHLLNFIRGNGTLYTNDHTVLISHTANGILTSLTGMYSDRHGQAVSNSYRYFRNDGSGLTNSSSSFKYWTDLTDDVNTPPTDANYNMVNADSGTNKNAPAPWVPYTRAGCDWGATALANVVLENTGTGPAGDMTKVFGANSPEWNEALASNTASAGTAARNLAQTDFIGLAVHCAQNKKSICNGNANAKSDQLPDEPGGYTGYQGLFGGKYVNPAICKTNASNCTNATVNGQTALKKLDGTPITDQFGQPGFPGFDGLFASTTLFVFNVEEGDHFAGSIPTPTGCDGVNVPCNYSLRGEINGNLAGLLKTQQGITTPFAIHSDMAPTLYLSGNPARTSATARAFGRAVGALRATNPYTGINENITAALADQVEERALHMVTADPQRTPNLTMFALPDYFLFASSAPATSPPCDEGGATPPCITVPTTPPTNTFAWNHGGIQPEIATTWLGLVGPGVNNGAVDSTTWADHSDTRPTMLSLVGLDDTYVHDGAVLAGELSKSRMPQSVRRNLSTYLALRDAYKQLNAPFGTFAMSTLQASTRAIKSGSASDDSRYNSIEDQIATLTTSRDLLASSIKNALDSAFFDAAPLNVSQANSWIAQANALVVQAQAMAAST